MSLEVYGDIKNRGSIRILRNLATLLFCLFQRIISIFYAAYSKTVRINYMSAKLLLKRELLSMIWVIIMEQEDGINCKRAWELILEECKTLRNEELNKMDKQYQIVGLSVGGIATLLGLAIQYNVYPLFIILPIIIISAMSLYHFERLSILNVGLYIYNLENIFLQNKIKTDAKILGWETWIRKESKSRYTYAFIELISTFSLFSIYLLCVYGILASPSSVVGFKFFNSSLFRYSISLFYIFFGTLAYCICNIDNFVVVQEFLKQYQKKKLNV